MITELQIPYQVEDSGFIFTLGALFISVQNLDGDLMAILPVLNDNGYRIVRTEEQFTTEVAYWLKDNL